MHATAVSERDTEAHGPLLRAGQVFTEVARPCPVSPPSRRTARGVS